jgi:hypothetical protein
MSAALETRPVPMRHGKPRGIAQEYPQSGFAVPHGGIAEQHAFVRHAESAPSPRTNGGTNDDDG